MYIYMHSALTGVQVLVTRTPEHAQWLVHFWWGLLVVTTKKRKATEISYQMLVHWLLFSCGFILWHWDCDFMFDYDTKEEEHQNTRQFDLYLGGYVPSYKSDNLVFRCSFYYLTLLWWMDQLKDAEKPKDNVIWWNSLK
jgi:hypothetical protein